MHTELSPALRDDPEAQAAARRIQACVHCGFCTATCPSYQVLGNELDSPRGRIYLIKEVLEGVPATPDTQAHLDRCLTCRACETTCPSGVQYGALVETGRRLVDAQVPRPLGQRLLRGALGAGLTSPAFAPALRLGQWVRPMLPRALKDKVPPRRDPGPVPSHPRPRKVLLLAGCVQPAMSPGINAATRRVLDRLGIAVEEVEGCCGALRSHLGQHEAAEHDMRRLARRVADRLGSAEVLLSNASGCGVMVKDYAQALPGHPDAKRTAAAARDLGEWLFDPENGFVERLRALLGEAPRAQRIAYHPPCTLQHGQRLRGGVEAGLRALGFEVSLPADSHLCCGSAGTYSVLQADTANALRERKLAALQALQPTVVASGNIGCLTHLQAGTRLPVRHWVEVLDDALGR